MKIKIFGVGVAVVLAASVGAWAAIIAQEDFTGYTNGALAGQGTVDSGWAGAWTGGDSMVGDSPVLSYSGYVGGGGQKVTSPTVNALRTLSAATPGAPYTYYLAFLARFNSIGATAYTAGLEFPSPGYLRIGNLGSSGGGIKNQWGIGDTESSYVYCEATNNPVITSNTTYLVVMKINHSAPYSANVKLWVNPTLVLGEAGNTPIINRSQIDCAYTVGTTKLKLWAGAGADWDGFVLATTWYDLVVELGTVIGAK